MSSEFQQIAIIRPGTLSPRAFDFYTDLVFDTQISAAAHRIGNPDTGDWRLTWLVATPMPLEDVIGAIAVAAELADIGAEAVVHADDISIEMVPADDWLARSYRAFPPFSIGRFHLYGLHHAGAVVIPDGDIPLLIDAVTAFGSGEHPTTKGCLLLLQSLKEAGFTPDRVLDHGTGSGILAIAAYKLWGCPAVAADNDPESVTVAADYRDYNDIPAAMMPVFEAETPTAPPLAARGPYPLIIANILAAPLRTLAPDMAAAATPDARLVLSGLLESQKDEVVAAYTPHGFVLADTCIIGDWAAILLTRQ